LKVDKLAIPREQALKELEKYKETLKNRKKSAKYLKQMKQTYQFLARGKKIIDIFDVMQKGGVEKGLPRLAIAKAHRKRVIFVKRTNGRGSFGHGEKGYYEGEVILPSGTFRWKDKIEDRRMHYKAKVPIIPASLYPEGDLKDFWILWEVENWRKITIPPKDPFLLKRISKNLFAILGAWDLTPLERALIRGR